MAQQLTLAGDKPTSTREGYIYWMGSEMYGARWRNFNLILVEQRYASDAAVRLPTPRIINLTTHPHERERVSLPHLHSWVAYHFTTLTTAFRDSVASEPLIPMGAPVEYMPI
jgi:hypothetical protein